jgi:hypothetical protein
MGWFIFDTVQVSVGDGVEPLEEMSDSGRKLFTVFHHDPVDGRDLRKRLGQLSQLGQLDQTAVRWRDDVNDGQLSFLRLVQNGQQVAVGIVVVNESGQAQQKYVEEGARFRTDIRPSPLENKTKIKQK